jgi:hypothetical protein
MPLLSFERDFYHYDRLAEDCHYTLPDNVYVLYYFDGKGLWVNPVIFSDYTDALRHRDMLNNQKMILSSGIKVSPITEVFLFEDRALVTSCLVAEPAASEKW